MKQPLERCCWNKGRRIRSWNAVTKRPAENAIQNRNYRGCGVQQPGFVSSCPWWPNPGACRCHSMPEAGGVGFSNRRAVATVSLVAEPRCLPLPLHGQRKTPRGCTSHNKQKKNREREIQTKIITTISAVISTNTRGINQSAHFEISRLLLGTPISNRIGLFGTFRRHWSCLSYPWNLRNI